MTTLITGADGYVGRRIAQALSNDELLLAVRCADEVEFARKRAALAGFERATIVPVDLRDPNPLAHLDSRRITRIIHAAAVTRFDVDRDTARRVNLAGTIRVRDFATRCERLERLVHLSTLYTAGRHTGEIQEVRHDDAGFVNHYEWSKWAAEESLFDSPNLPVTVVRLPTLIAEDGSGAIGQLNAFHHTLRLYFYGLLTLLPGEPATPLSLASAEFAAEAVKALLGAEPGIYQACAEPISLGTAIETAFTVFERDTGFQRRMLPRPIPCDLNSFRDLMAAARGLRGGPLNAAIGSVAPFAEQLYLPKVFHSDRLRAAWPGWHAPDPVALVESVCSHLIARRSHVPAR